MKKLIQKRKGMQRAGGFTLIEVMVVVVILGVLAALVTQTLFGNVDEARVKAAKIDIATIEQAFKRYRLDNFSYPTTEQGVNALVTKPTIDPVPKNWRQYLDKLPKDPWGNSYQYLQPGQHGEMDVFSLGADGKPGGEGSDADVGNWEPTK